MNTWINKSYSNIGPITQETIINLINKFWEEVMMPLTNDQYIIFILRVGYTDGNYASLFNMQKVNNGDLDKILENFARLSDIKSEDYFNSPVDHIIISYKLISADKLKVKKSKIVEIKIKDLTPTTRLKGYNFPNTTDVNLYGDILKKGDGYYLIRKPNSNLIYNITFLSDHHHVRIHKYNEFIIEFKDYFTEDNSTFTRIVKDQTYIYSKGIIAIKKVVKNISYLNSVNPSKKLVNKYITLDIETLTLNNIMKPYCISYYDGIKSLSYYLSDFKNSEDMIVYALSSIIKSKYHGYSVYIHNLSKFDGVFILNILKKYLILDWT